MAKRKQSEEAKVHVGQRMRKHMEKLGLPRPRDYLIWCENHGFAASLEKDRAALEGEFEAFARDRIRADRRAKLHRNPVRFIEQVCAREIGPADITSTAWRDFASSIQARRADQASRKALCELLLLVHKKAGFLFESVTFGNHAYRYVDALIRLNERRGQWIRNLEDWQPTSHNRHRQFSSLVRHLLANYPVPGFMDSVWFRTDPGSHRLRDWFMHIGSGKNIRTAKTPVPLTKRMAHFFIEAPDNYSIEHAVRWGQIHALGGDRRLTEAVLATSVGESFEHDDFWISVFRFFVANPMLDRKHVGPIVDFLQAQKFQAREVMTGPGRVEVQEPPQPNLTMRGRTANSLLRQVDAWHRELGRTKAADNLYFRRSGIAEFELATGKGKRDRWRIRELLSGAELVAEGRAMRHCVASYAGSCANGHSSIWAMELHTVSGVEKRQTVEITNQGMIVQSRGKQNRLPSAGEFDILRKWARSAGLKVSNYVRAAD